MSLKIIIPSPREAPALYTSASVAVIGAALWWMANVHPQTCERWFGQPGPGLCGTVGMCLTMLSVPQVLMDFARAQPPRS